MRDCLPVCLHVHKCLYVSVCVYVCVNVCASVCAWHYSSSTDLRWVGRVSNPTMKDTENTVWWQCACVYTCILTTNTLHNSSPLFIYKCINLNKVAVFSVNLLASWACLLMGRYQSNSGGRGFTFTRRGSGGIL